MHSYKTDLTTTLSNNSIHKSSATYGQINQQGTTGKVGIGLKRERKVKKVTLISKFPTRAQIQTMHIHMQN